MKNSAVLSCEELKAITGYQRPADVARCLREQGVRVFNGRTGPWTTLDLINQAGGLVNGANEEEIDPKKII
ncbi:DUF4224 domain-containing protein [Chromohalobacter israelensis]|uniref:DUF4224 domain-containing protein n=1 Tax=Chromohalobacter israelensis TaxID=141390 RepID=UPI001CC48E26|nr:DUF4224 domain-containing protein [Chromohalobacter salexigens]MBZ5875977.1 DUF4224 domain-containing protein [Chromohalobacter salexigens]